jgi:hypothetical protein
LKFSKSHLLNVAMIVALVATAVIGHQMSPLLLPKADATGIVEPGCDLQRKACPATLPGGGRIELSITPRPIPFLQALRVEVTIVGIEPRKVEVDFAGESMNMGYNRSELTAHDSGRYGGEVSLPVCVSGGMTWVATVIVETDGERIAVPYRFDVGH